MPTTPKKDLKHVVIVTNPYRDRDYVCGQLDQRVFDGLNVGSGQFAVPNLASYGCLDALEMLPAGSMVSTCDGFSSQSQIERGMTAVEVAQRDAYADALIDEIIDEEMQSPYTI